MSDNFESDGDNFRLSEMLDSVQGMSPAQLFGWTCGMGERLLRDRDPTLGILIEMAAILNVGGQESLILAVLADPTLPTKVVGVAAQRARCLAWALVSGVGDSDWKGLSVASVEEVVRALLVRHVHQWNQPDLPPHLPPEPDLRGALVFALARLATPNAVDEIARILARSWLRARDCEGVMAVMGGVPFLKKGVTAWQAIGAAFENTPIPPLFTQGWRTMLMNYLAAVAA